MRLVSTCCRADTESHATNNPPWDHFCGECGGWLSPELHRKGIYQMILIPWEDDDEGDDADKWFINHRYGWVYTEEGGE